MGDSENSKRRTLLNSEITTGRLTRRALFTALGGAVALSTRPALAGCYSDTDSSTQYADPSGGPWPLMSVEQAMASDHDEGAGCDPLGQGRRHGNSGLTDSDGGPKADPRGNGRWGN